MEIFGVILGVKTCEVFLCFITIVISCLYCVDFSVASLYQLFYITPEFHRFTELTPSMSRYLLLLSVVVNFFILGNFLGKSTKDKKLTTTCVSLTCYSSL